MVSGVGPRPPLPPPPSHFPPPLLPSFPISPSPLPPLPPEGLGVEGGRLPAARRAARGGRVGGRAGGGAAGCGEGGPGGWRSWGHPVTEHSVSGVTPAQCREPDRPRFCQRRSLTLLVTSLLCHPAAGVNVYKLLVVCRKNPDTCSSGDFFKFFVTLLICALKCFILCSLCGIKRLKIAP